jgi:hypothetical protein
MTVKSYSDLVAEATDQVLEAFGQAQEFSLRATEAAVSLVPGDPALRLAQRLPAPKHMVQTTFDVAAKALDHQRRYALRMTDVLVGGAARATTE